MKTEIYIWLITTDRVLSPKIPKSIKMPDNYQVPPPDTIIRLYIEDKAYRLKVRGQNQYINLNGYGNSLTINIFADVVS